MIVFKININYLSNNKNYINMKQKRQLLRGVLSLLILSELIDKPTHGYALESDINKMLGEKLPRGTVYVILKYLEKQGCIRSEVHIEKRKINVYTLTDVGKEMLKNHIELLKKVNTLSEKIIRKAEKL
jgi:DNA-binding PadR family transcriptional regulator